MFESSYSVDAFCEAEDISRSLLARTRHALLHAWHRPAHHRTSPPRLAPPARGRGCGLRRGGGVMTSKWREKYRVHPAADVFPMMSDDELAALGADIKARGLLEPIKIRGDEILDGRNRLEAIERADISFKSLGCTI